MKRISLTVDEKTLEKLDAWVNSDFEIEFKGNRSGYLNKLIESHTPEVPQ